MKTLKQPLLAISLFIFSLFSAISAHAAYDNATALKGLDEAKGVVLIDIGEAEKLALYLEVLQGTHQGFVDQGVNPDLIFVFIGPTVNLLTSQPEPGLAAKSPAALKRIATAITGLKASGVKLEICAVATKLFGLDDDKLLPELDIVADGFISLIGYQHQGYQQVTIF